ncbi:ash family protein [Necropsobacter rosorum]|uniref:ash family protein n=1 Tax=Necropsobacter rosorum TaxID=908285 RepID=UPI003C7B8BDF
MNLNHLYYKQYENISQYDTLQSAVNFGIISPQSQKTIAEPRNSKNKTLAHSTPYACFFMRDLHTPKERLARLSMVACSGKGFALCCVPMFAVFEPVTRYRPSLETLAVTSKNSTLELSAMIYLFLGIRRQDLANTGLTFNTFPRARIAIQADNEQAARARLAKNWLLLQAWQFKNRSEIHRTFIKGVIYA